MHSFHGVRKASLVNRGGEGQGREDILIQVKPLQLFVAGNIFELGTSVRRQALVATTETLSTHLRADVVQQASLLAKKSQHLAVLLHQGGHPIVRSRPPAARGRGA